MDQQITEHSSATWDLLNSDPNEQANDVYFSNKHSPDAYVYFNSNSIKLR